MVKVVHELKKAQSELVLFMPDILFVSLGFNTEESDSDNFDAVLKPGDYEQITSRILEIADACGSVPVVFFLEGGAEPSHNSQARAAQDTPRPLLARTHRPRPPLARRRHAADGASDGGRRRS